MVNIAVLVSGGGSNLQALLDAQETGKIEDGRIALVVSSCAEAFALQRAEQAGVPTAVVARADYADRETYAQALINTLLPHNIGLVVLAGFLCVLAPSFIRQYEDRIVNVHPSLIPAFCGDGYYGLRVHEQALAHGAKVTGATVHFVNEITDGGAIIAQKAVDILPDDSPQILQKRVMEQAEWVLLPQAVALFCQGKLRIAGRTVQIS